MNTRFWCAAVAATVFAELITPTKAEASETTGASTQETPRTTSISVDPFPALFGVGVVHGEVRVAKAPLLPGHAARDISVGGWLGFGRLRRADDGIWGSVPVWSDCKDMFYCDRATTVMIGAQALAYPLGDFEHGLQVGLEASALYFWGTRRFSETLKALALNPPPGTFPDQKVQGFAFLPGLVVGYKLVTAAGFTVNPQLAADVVISSEPIAISPRLGVYAGWSF